MTDEMWTRWPSREALSQAGVHTARRVFGRVTRSIALGLLIATTFIDSELGGWALAGGVAGIVVFGLLAWAFQRTTLEHRLKPSLALIAALLGLAALGQAAGFRVPALVLLCGCAVNAIERLPLVYAVPSMAVALAAFAVVDNDGWPTTAAVTAGLALSGYVVRLDAEARGSAQSLLAQERAARAAEAESSALAERARIAREIHDVLAHSLSAQLVHLEAARLLIERGANREAILDRVVAARGMAREGLAETRHALSALRGEMSPAEDFLRELVRSHEGADVLVTGERRPLEAEASQAVRRVAQEALTNVRKHAPGATVRIRLDYREDQVMLEVRDSGGGPGDLGGSGAGYGLLGMRERAQLLGGSLEAGPSEEGFVVTLKVPV
ncbi:sensor histidine kinase [Streptomyces sp. NPDC048566]|uniref:sensor histidine kinase n=1 Tax=Streptomyces sp. NPDC048566 TaxID=3365569 RepID=UPI00371A63F6